MNDVCLFVVLDCSMKEKKVKKRELEGRVGSFKSWGRRGFDGIELIGGRGRGFRWGWMRINFYSIIFRTIR